MKISKSKQGDSLLIITITILLLLKKIIFKIIEYKKFKVEKRARKREKLMIGNTHPVFLATV